MRIGITMALAVSSCSPSEPRPIESFSPWPLNADRAIVSCIAERDPALTVGDQRYAEPAEIAAIAVPGADTGPLLRRAREFCRESTGSLELVPGPKIEVTEEPARPRVTVERLPNSRGVVARITSEVGARANILCELEQRPLLIFETGRVPSAPPPLRGVFATLSAGSAFRARLELSWTGERDRWLLRDDDRSENLRVVRELLRAPSLSFAGENAAHLPARIDWHLDFAAADRAAFREACGL